MRINARAGALLLHDTYVRTYVRTPGAFWSVDLDIYIYTRDARIALVGRASSQWSFQCAPPSLMII